MVDPAIPWGSFLSTITEWHYFIGGVCLGFVIGWLAHVYTHRRLYGG